MFHYVSVPHFVYAFASVCVDYFYFLAIINQCEHSCSSLGVDMMWVFISLGYIPKSKIVGSFSNSVFGILRNNQTIVLSS